MIYFMFCTGNISWNLEKGHVGNFLAFFVKKAFEMRQQGAPKMTDELFALVTGSMPIALSYLACAVNGVKFVCSERDANRKTQNSGVFVPAQRPHRSTVY